MVQGKYEVKRLLGKGGMGAVFLAQDLTLDREVAIKVLPPEVSQDPKLVQRFQQEAKTAAKLDHTNIIPIYRVESEGGLNYFVMKFIAGTNLEDVLEDKKQLPVDYIQRVLWEAARALGHAHTRGIVHRDVKPANIMFDHDGKVMLTDFGISKALQAASGFTGTGMIIGTPHYMAPEQAKGQTVDGRADQYSLGVVGYRMVTGQLPFSGDSVHTILYKHIFEDPPPARDTRADVPEFLSAGLARAMAKDPAQRYATMEEFATALWPEQPVVGGATAPATMRPRTAPQVSAEMPTEQFSSAPTTPLPSAGVAPRKPVTRTQPEPKKSRAGLVIGVLVVLVGGGAAAVMMMNKDGGQTDTPTQTASPQPPGRATPSGPVVTELRVTPATLQLRTGQRGTLAAAVLDAAGQPMSGQQIAWSSSDASVARVDARGEVTALKAGLVQIEARVGTVRDEAAVQVAAPQTAAAPTGGRPTQQTPTQPAQEWGFVSITSDVPATVFINGTEAGETPVGNYRVRPGAVTIKLEAVGYRAINERVTVEAGGTVRKRYTMTPEG